MRATNSETSWGWAQRLLHWGMAALILFMLVLGVWMVRLDDVFARFGWVQLHKSWGVAVFGLALVRLLWRLRQPASPAAPRQSPRWERAAARAAHAALYALMFALPVTGWLLASASPLQDRFGLPTVAFGVLALPDPFVPGDQALEDGFRTLHAALAIGLAGVIAIHAAGALRHHFALKDDVLKRMTFGR